MKPPWPALLSSPAHCRPRVGLSPSTAGTLSWGGGLQGGDLSLGSQLLFCCWVYVFGINHWCNNRSEGAGVKHRDRRAPTGILISCGFLALMSSCPAVEGSCPAKGGKLPSSPPAPSPTRERWALSPPLTCLLGRRPWCPRTVFVSVWVSRVV